eukprot:193927_1
MKTLVVSTEHITSNTICTILQQSKSEKILGAEDSKTNYTSRVQLEQLTIVDVDLLINREIRRQKKHKIKIRNVQNIMSRFSQGKFATQRQSNDFYCHVVSICMMSD